MSSHVAAFAWLVAVSLVAAASCQLVSGGADFEVVTGSGGTSSPGGGGAGGGNSTAGSGGGGGGAGLGGSGGAAPVDPWALRWGDSAAQQAAAIAVDTNDDIVITGSFAGSMSFAAATPLASAGQEDIYLAKLDTDGALLWAKRFGDTASDLAQGVALDDAGNIYLVGSFRGTLPFGNTTLGPAVAEDAFIAKLDPAGSPLWAVSLSGAGNAEAQDVAWSAVDDVIAVVGDFSGDATFHDGAKTSAGSVDAFLVRLDAGGTFLDASYAFGDANADYLLGVSFDHAGNILLAGQFTGAIDLGDGSPHTATGWSDALVAKRTSLGAPDWSLAFGGPGWLDVEFANDVAADSQNRVFAVGGIGDGATLGGSPVTTNGFDGVVLQLQPNGTHAWHHVFGGAGLDALTALGVDDQDRVAVTGACSAGVTFDAQELPCSVGDVFVALHDDAGGFVWGKPFPGPDTQVGMGIAPDGAGSLILIGHFQGNVDFGTGVMTSAGGDDVFLAKLIPGP